MRIVHIRARVHWAWVWQWATVSVADFCLLIVLSMCAVYWWEAFHGVDIQSIDVFSRFLGFIHTGSRTQHNIYLQVVFSLDQISSLGSCFQHNDTLEAPVITSKPSNKLWLSWQWWVRVPTGSVNTSWVAACLCFCTTWIPRFCSVHQTAASGFASFAPLCRGRDFWRAVQINWRTEEHAIHQK